VEEARNKGQAVTADQYPYTASSTSLGAMVVPDEYRNQEKLVEALGDPQESQRLRDQIDSMLAARSGGASLFIASYSRQRDWQGKDLASLAKQQRRSVVDLVLEIQQNGGASMINFGMSEEEVRLIMQQAFVATASDGGAKVPDDTVPHPRSYGTFPRKIGNYALANKTVAVKQAIRSSSGLPADILRLVDRGYLRAGYFADIVLFDPDDFREVATFERPHQYSTGVRYLIVNGQFAVDGGKPTGVMAGRALRYKAAASEEKLQNEN
jgi:N-acyl-D-aspartate/D-glutamate deacylase